MSIRRRHRLRHAPHVELDITAFMNLMVILVPFLLITAVFSRVAVMQLSLPQTGEEAAAVKKAFELQVVLSDKQIGVRESLSGFRKIISATDEAAMGELNDVMQRMKNQFPSKQQASLLVEKNVSYDTLVQAMDAMRIALLPGREQQMLFSDIAIGDAPARRQR